MKNGGVMMGMKDSGFARNQSVRNLFGHDVCIPTGTTRPVNGLPPNLPPDILDRLHQNDRLGLFDKN